MLTVVKKELKKYARKQKAKILKRFFKTGPGEYGEGDIFIGVVVPDIRKVSLKFKNLSLKNCIKLVKSPAHEERLLALLIMVKKFEETIDEREKKEIYTAYMSSTQYINNWDLVDLTAHRIAGAYLENKNKDILFSYARSKSLWERRIAVLTTFYYIRNKSFDMALQIAGMLINDEEDLIHKAVGWMLREIGKRDKNVEEKFLKYHYKTMPRTMLRYAIEKFPESKRKAYLKK